MHARHSNRQIFTLFCTQVHSFYTVLTLKSLTSKRFFHFPLLYDACSLHSFNLTLENHKCKYCFLFDQPRLYYFYLQCDLVLDAAHRKNTELSIGPRKEDIVESIIFKASDVVVVTFKDADLNFARKGTCFYLCCLKSL